MNWISDHLTKLDRSEKALRRFGFTIAAVLILAGVAFILRHRSSGVLFLGLGLILPMIAAAAPGSLKYFYLVWMAFSFVIGWIMTHLILTMVFVFVVTPIGWLQKLCGQRALELAFRTGEISYWTTRTKHPAPTDYEKQF